MLDRQPYTHGKDQRPASGLIQGRRIVLEAASRGEHGGVVYTAVGTALANIALYSGEWGVADDKKTPLVSLRMPIDSDSFYEIKYLPGENLIALNRIRLYTAYVGDIPTTEKQIVLPVSVQTLGLPFWIKEKIDAPVASFYDGSYSTKTFYPGTDTLACNYILASTMSELFPLIPKPHKIPSVFSNVDYEGGLDPDIKNK